MEIKTRGLLIGLIARFEGLYLRPYLDPIGIPTVGLGTIRYPNGLAVTLSDREITKDEAYKYAWFELEVCIRQAVKLSPCLASHPERLAAIASFIYNLGPGAYRGSTLRKRINAEDWEGAKVQILKWNKAGGKVYRGLTLRRQAESELL